MESCLSAIENRSGAILTKNQLHFPTANVDNILSRK